MCLSICHASTGHQKKPQKYKKCTITTLLWDFREEEFCQSLTRAQKSTHGNNNMNVAALRSSLITLQDPEDDQTLKNLVIVTSGKIWTHPLLFPHTESQSFNDHRKYSSSEESNDWVATTTNLFGQLVLRLDIPACTQILILTTFWREGVGGVNLTSK